MATEWRFMIFGNPAAPWRGDRKQAQRDAVDAGLGDYDENGTFFLTVPGELISRPVEDG